MCLAVPGKVVSIDASADPLTGLIDFGGVQKVRDREPIRVHRSLLAARECVRHHLADRAAI